MWRVCLLASACFVAPAQQFVTSAVVSGHVEDASGATLVQVVVHLRNTDRNQDWKQVADDQGRFRFAPLPAGEYALEAQSPRFTTARLRLTLRAGEALDLPVVMAVASEIQQVEVSAEAPGIEMARTQTADSVSTREIESLPLNGRNYLDLALLVPGVSRTNTGTNQRFAETSAIPGTGISVNGQRNLNNGFVVDGLSANDDAAALAGAYYSQEVVREFQVVTSGGIAEFGRASSGVISIITQSGTNQWHGKIYGFARNQRLDARNPIATRKDPLTQTQYGASTGGPLAKDRTFLFANFEQTRQNAAGFVTIVPATGFPTGEYPTDLRATNFFSRVDHSLTRATQIALRYSLYDVASRNSRGVGGLNAVSRGTALYDRDQNFALTGTSALSTRGIAEFRVQMTRGNLAAPVNDPAGPAINISGVANLGMSSSSPTSREATTWEANGGISQVRGNHSIKVGADALYNRVTIGFPGAMRGMYSFSSLANYRAGNYITYQQAFGEPNQFVGNPNAGFFAQDEWKPRPGLTVNAGMRYDVQWLPAPARTDRADIAPRMGMAWSPDSRTVVRASGGIFFDRLPLRALSNAMQRDGVRYRVAVLSASQAGAPIFPNILSVWPEGVVAAITTIDAGLRNAYSAQAGVQIERDLGGGAAVSAGYQRLRGVHILLSRNLNVPVDPAAPNLGRPDPRFANISQYEGAGDSYYNGLTLGFRQRLGKSGGVRLSWTLSHAIDDAGNFFFSTPQNNFNLRDDRGASDNDQRHRVSAAGWIERRGFQISAIVSYASALPFNVQTGTDRNRDTNVNDRPEGVGRNTGRGFDSAALDLRVSRRFRIAERGAIEVLAEGFNVLNRANWQVPNNVISAASFGRPTAAADPRQAQLGVRVSF